ncbi:type IV pilus biogenesis/stability protein PilW [Acidovorax sp. SRB_14]|uniref:type IV pilus biogenesis/stability protein PilW n=1 Tax=unclassified Acidovorax TaxID=2684926 RepID=UPI00145E8CE7|nr:MULTISPECIES: type IV pilus biogenesis/stability protein PilW [unclassified Acidovorax]NMM77851.1 type IV pilus biogenesis/stability protein PilW [Acidovorax sp. SRB_24]NMM82528.1 type IV pilus biogenesis/stability protein PilW [Acidovorax sp. SRB_14]NMM89445.1 type IV pilus biogenesis/stability protein PilW [Rhodococcus sp. SRB_17]
MAASMARWRPWVAGLCMGGALIVGVAGVSGCSAQPGASASGQEFLTPSDEPEARRRARIRLELAANYFESGQTTVALDEIKQAIATDPGYADAYNLRGLIYMRLNEYAQAEGSFRRALGVRSNDPSVLHNYAWLLCLQQKYAEADQQFARVLSQPAYPAKGKTLMAQGLCQARAGQAAQAEQTLVRAYELDAGNPIVGYNLAHMLLQRGEAAKAQFYIRRLNNSEMANSESLWLGIKVERALGDRVASEQLASQLHKRFPDSREQSLHERGIFNE